MGRRLIAQLIAHSQRAGSDGDNTPGAGHFAGKALFIEALVLAGALALTVILVQASTV